MNIKWLVSQLYQRKRDGKILTNALPFLLTVQKHGLKVYMRDPHAFTPMLEEGVRGQPPRSLLLGNNLAMNQREIAKFSEKDAKVYTTSSLIIYHSCFSCGSVL